MKRFYVYTIMVLAILSCGRKTESGQVPLYPFSKDHFIDSYFRAIGLRASRPLVVNDAYPFGNIVFDIIFDREYLYAEEEKEIQEQVGDIARIGGEKNTPRIASVNPFSKLTIVSDSDFNDIPAGSPLDAIIRVIGATAWPVFKDLHCEDDYYYQELDGSLKGYKSVARNDGTGTLSDIARYFHPSFFWYEKFVSELRPDDLFLSGPAIFFGISETPAIKKQKLTITLEEEGGKTYSCDVDVEFPS